MTYTKVNLIYLATTYSYNNIDGYDLYGRGVVHSDQSIIDEAEDTLLCAGSRSIWKDVSKLYLCIIKEIQWHWQNLNS